jgi:beta-glucosidase/6-phospho-beta-glucosidase/beta-galactosidase
MLTLMFLREQFPPGRMIDPRGLEYVLKYLQRKYGNISIYIQDNDNPSSLCNNILHASKDLYTFWRHDN